MKALKMPKLQKTRESGRITKKPSKRRALEIKGRL